MTSWQDSCPILRAFVCISLVLLPLFGFAAAGTITATIGESIPLNGTVQLVDTVYLFVTGPGIPVNGARMENSNAPVVTGDPGTFTQVMVENERWSYTWNTGRVSGGLAPGSHTVYISTEPVAKNALSGVKYAEVEIILKKAVTTGKLEIETDPGDAEIYLNEKYSGNSPRVFENLAPGEYAIRLDKAGYATETGSATLTAGGVVKFTRTLSPAGTPGSPASTSKAASPSPTTVPAGSPVPPATTAPLSAGCITAIFILAGILCVRRA